MDEKELQREYSLYTSTRQGAGHREGIRSCNFQKEKCNIQKNHFGGALDHISMHFQSSSQPGAGDTLINCSGLLRANDIYLFGILSKVQVVNFRRAEAAYAPSTCLSGC